MSDEGRQRRVEQFIYIPFLNIFFVKFCDIANTVTIKNKMQQVAKKSFTQKLRTDFSGRVFNTLRRNRLSVLKTISTIVARLILNLKGVHLGKRVVFFGLPYVHRKPMSTIFIGNDCTIRSDQTSNLVGVNRKCIFSTANENAIIKIGNNVGITAAVIGAAEKIIIGDDVLIGANVLITDWDWHVVDPHLRHSEGGKSSPVIIEDNVWIGINSIILKGVSIGKNTIIGANSVVTKNIPNNVIAGGNPCRVIKIIEMEVS